MAGIDEVYEMVVKGKTKAVELAVQEALAEGCAPAEILNAGMIRAMDEVGAQFKTGEIFVPEMLMSARAMKKGVEVLRPQLVTGKVGSAGRAVIGTVAGDLHDIGKNLVAMMLESAGFEVIDLGVDVSQGKICESSGKESGHQPGLLLGPPYDDPAVPAGHGRQSEQGFLPERISKSWWAERR